MKNYKNIFPFKISTTSYILHAKKNNVIKNINYLKKSFNKIQLLFFGKNHLDIFLNPVTLQNLSKIKNESSIDYSIHLPIDLDLLNDSSKLTQDSLDTVYKIFDDTEHLNIKEYILHIDKNRNEVKLNKKNFDKFKKVCKSIKQKIPNPDFFYIENTNYDLTFFKDIILENGYSVCLDIGHIICFNHEFDPFINIFNNVINEIHIHGVKKGKDHLSLDKLDNKYIKSLINYLTIYKKSVTIEVFNRSNLIKSVKFLKKQFRKDKHGIKIIN